MTLAAKFIVTLVLLNCTLASALTDSTTPFRFHVPNEPSSLAPAQLGSADVSLLFHNLYRGLYTFSSEKGLMREGAESCRWSDKNLVLICKIAKTSLWSDGKAIEASDYVRGWRELFSGKAKPASSEVLLNVKNARAILKGEKKFDQLGATAVDTRTLRIEFEKPDPEFLNKLALVTLVPIRSENFPERERSQELITNGPYKISKWKVGSRLYLEPNKLFHPESAAARPLVEILFIEEDLTALNLYESGELTFMRRLPTQHFGKYASRSDFRNFAVARFDYLGFGDDLASRPHLRKALALSANFAELQKIYKSPGMPGCPALSEKLFANFPCLKFDLATAKKELEISKKTENIPPRLQIAFSKLGGDSVLQGMEWFQSQWTKNLGLQIDLTPMEQGVYLSVLRSKPPTIFRKGVGLDRPTCLAAVETFTKDGAENFLKFSDPKYESLVKQLAAAKTDSQKRKQCSLAVEYLLSQFRLIPLGRFMVSSLVSPKFTGWTVNELQQLDLTNLKRSP